MTDRSDWQAELKKQAEAAFLERVVAVMTTAARETGSNAAPGEPMKGSNPPVPHEPRTSSSSENSMNLLWTIAVTILFWRFVGRPLEE